EQEVPAGARGCGPEGDRRAEPGTAAAGEDHPDDLGPGRLGGAGEHHGHAGTAASTCRTEPAAPERRSAAGPDVGHDRSMTTTVQGIAGLKELVGQHLGYSDYLEITQERVNLFADATGDHQWIHVDPERAKAESPFGGPIAHGYLTLSLGPVLVPQVV